MSVAARRTLADASHDTTFAVLKLTLHPTGYDFEFVVDPRGACTDAGSAYCH
ncbi:MAG TPA: hypothetical protein VHK89_08100 [Actinomycetota bacterium]|nr:hypothetical protein [Actinomycetota bacterium]